MPLFGRFIYQAKINVDFVLVERIIFVYTCCFCVHMCICASVPMPNLLKAALIPPSPLSPSTTLCNRWEFAGEIMFFEPHTHSICQKKQRKSAIRFDSCTDHLISPLFSHQRHSFSTKSHEICSKRLSTFLCLSLRVTFIKMRLLSLWALHSSCCHNEFLCQSLYHFKRKIKRIQFQITQFMEI